tara:strand:- start:65 stop:775 length:711 start_codon:yes stop_codon:yes gene_type:complete
MPVAPVKISYVNPIQQWYKSNTPLPQLSKDYGKYDKGMLISISNNQLYHNDIVKDFKELYISFLLALTGKKISKWDLRGINGEWYRDRVKLPSRNNLLNLIANKIPVMLCAVHNYKKDDIRSGGKEYCHTHLYVYNAHHYLPSNPVELADKEDKIERHLARYTNLRKRLQGVTRITPVGHGIHQYTDQVLPLTLYDYLLSPITKPEDNNVINYMANNRHLPSIQYPLTFIYCNKSI